MQFRDKPRRPPLGAEPPAVGQDEVQPAAVQVLGNPKDPSKIAWQVVLSFGIPFALVPLVRLTSKRELMGDDVNHRITSALGAAVGVVIIVLNVGLIYLTMR